MRAIRRLASILLLVGGFALSAAGHDIPNARVDRSIQATLHPGRLEIDYEVSLSELTLIRDLRRLLGEVPETDRNDWPAAYGRETGPLNGRGLIVAIDRRDLDLRFLGFELHYEEHPRYLFHYEVEIPREGSLTILDTNFESGEGTSRLAIRARDGILVHGDDLPPDVDSIAIRPVWQLSDAEERRTRRVEVTYGAPRTRSANPVSPSLAPDGSRKPPMPATLATPRLTRLLERTADLPVAVLALLAFGVGATHAVQPGHGKTLVAAAVLGERGTWLRGVLLAIVTTATHTGSVLLVAIGLWWTQATRYGEIHLALAHTAGGLIAAIGLWRLGRHLGGYGEHDIESPIVDPPAVGRPGLVGLGVAGGLVPCWDAIALIVLAGATGRVALGVGLLLAFGSGMATVLVVVGTVAARVRRMVLPRPGDVASRDPWERRLGIVSGATLAVIGVYLLVVS